MRGVVRTRWLVVALGVALLGLPGQGRGDTSATGQPHSSAAQPPPPPQQTILSEIAIGGNEQVDTEAIRIRLSSRPGQPLNPETVDTDIRSIYEMGFFKNIEARLDEHDGQQVLTYWVRERPLIRQVRVEGHKKVSQEEILTALKIHPRTILN